jgi:regulatory protein
VASGQGDGGAPPRRGRRGFGARARAPADPASVSGARSRAIGVLARRDLPRKALKGRLTEVGYGEETAETAVAELEDELLVNDARYVESAVAARISRGQGPIRILMELRRLGVAPELLNPAVDSRSPEWVERATALRRRRFGGQPPGNPKESTRQARFLLYRGFTGEQVRRALGRAAAEIEDLELTDDLPVGDPEAG